MVEADPQFAVAGGNVCAIAQQRGIAGFVVDGVIRDLAQVRELLVTLYERTAAGHPARLEQLTSAQQDLLQLPTNDENGEEF